MNASIYNKKRVSRIGITMRITTAENYDEPRDTLAQDWGHFMAAALPTVSWMAIPNLGEKSIEYVKNWEINGLIFSGGDDLGKTPARDKTEQALLGWAIENNIPAFGVCRGLQLFASQFGGSLSLCKDMSHVAVEHDVKLASAPILGPYSATTRRVNSYHNQVVSDTGFQEGVVLLAQSSDGNIEALQACNGQLLAVMWHPERRSDGPDDLDLHLLQSHFLGQHT